MTTLRHQIRIDAPIDAVWKAVADLADVANYNPTVTSARVISEHSDGMGATRRCELKPKGSVEERVWHWNPPAAIGLEVSASTWPISEMRWKTELRPDGTGTVVSQEMTYAPKFGPLGAIMDAMAMRRQIDAGVTEVFNSLKRYVESRERRTTAG